MKAKTNRLRGNRLLAAMGISSLVLIACHKNDDNKDNTSAEKGYISGLITDTKGKPISGADIIIDNTVIYNSNYISVSDASGKYKVKLSGNFTWMAYASMKKLYNGKTYEFDLHPEKEEGFTSDGGVRNFAWKLTGEKPGSTGRYGASIQLQSAFGSAIMAEDVDFILTPVGSLIDGTTGQTLTLRGGPPRSATYFKLVDIPLGRYKLKAKYNNQFLPLLNTITNEKGTELTVNFEPEINLAGGYCNNCAMIQYDE